MKIDYRVISDYLEVDVEQLRPKGSYKKLIDKRSYPIDKLINEFGKIPNDYLKLRDCPNCNSNNLQFFINAGGYGKNLRVIAKKNEEY